MAKIGALLIGVCAVAVACAIPALAEPTPTPSPTVDAALAPKMPADVYTLATSANGGQPCSATDPADLTAVFTLISTRLGASYVVTRKYKTAPDILASYVATGKPANVVIATVCKTLDVYSISITGYALAVGKSTSNSLSGTFDALETQTKAAWLNLFGTSASPLFPNVAFLPVANDTTGIINSRLQRNLPITIIATPAPAPIAPPPPGAPAPPLPPTTRLGACQASAYRMLIVGRTTTASQSTDLTRLIVAGSSLKFSQPHPWGTVYTVLGAVVGLLYIPNSAEVGADVFVCPAGSSDEISQVNGLDGHITGHKTSPTIGADPFVVQRTLDTAVVDLANQLDCIVANKLEQLKIQDVPPKDDLAKSPWCATYYKSLKADFKINGHGPINSLTTPG
jgi:hypothetical protein